jgi:hypothetical protein
MPSPRYGPDETWPSHDKKHWHEPLAAARAAGWTLTYLDAPHCFGVVRCPAGEHSFSVDKTARNSETMAKEALKKISRCGHPAGRVRIERDEAQHLLDMAAQITADVIAGLVAAEAKLDAQEVLDRLELQLETAALNVAEVLAVQEAALEEAIAFDDAPDPPVLRGKLNEATEAVTEGEYRAKLIGGGHPGVAKSLLAQATTLRTRIDELRSRVAALQERKDSNSTLSCWDLPTIGVYFHQSDGGGSDDSEDLPTSTGDRSA